ncbi:probable serine/threonine-protein kinase dyrk2 [Sabethes cyaneus]|uniref:probable serine/threonine-protein kinase dyrk2 n=1 Tax=Sabethes cyaneus TaxID=53552 RepID=UPI00237E925A|nr:probable serine/threonine-protein kinase dyrk2 [Sabethes cyaneus]
MNKPSVVLLTLIALFSMHLSLASSALKNLPNGVAGTSQNSETQSQNITTLQGKLNATVSNVIAAMEETSFPGEQPNQEHAKKGRIMPRKGVDINATFASTTAATTMTTASNVNATSNASEAKPHNVAVVPMVNASDSNSNSSSSNAAMVGSNNTTFSKNPNASEHESSSSKNATSAAISVSSKVTVSPTASSSTTSTTTAATTTTTKTPNKPKITYSVDDEPRLLQAAKPGYNSAASSLNSGVSSANGRLHIEEPLAELSKEYIQPVGMMEPSRGGHREYVVPVVTLIFAIPLLIGLFLLSYRRAKEFWLTRHYRRMDFLVDGMYNY